MRLMTAGTSCPPWMQASTRSSLVAPAPAEADGEEGAEDEGTGPWSLRWWRRRWPAVRAGL
uniref:Uncharacterized protein n=1 Tax=Arundo donax TaxID=35708 RepID=A0A0A9AJ16_ARUDO